MKKMLLLITCFATTVLYAGTLDTVSIYSNSMHRPIPAIVIKPSRYSEPKIAFGVVYLLHGYSGDYANWISRVPELKQYADDYQLMIVCPDGGFGSWYFDSPLDSNYRYETHVALEVVKYIDQHYRTIADKKHRAITGLSMGGHGALFLALRHPAIFGAAGSMSGGVDLDESIGKFEVSKRIGDTSAHKKDWHDLSVLNMVEQYQNTPVKIIFDCGTQDIFIKGNRRLNEKMLRLNIPHDYTERAGQHNWEYWRNSIPYQLLFFRNYFYNR